MNRNELPAIGQPLEGGFYTGIIQVSGEHYALITAPKQYEITSVEWGQYGKSIDAESVNDCRSNTIVMGESGSEVAKQVLALEIAGFSDWSIPSRDAVELQYRNLKPTTQETYCSFRDGDNPSSIPPGFPYKKSNPLPQTNVELFRSGNAEAFEPHWYWTSTQYSAGDACCQDFEGGDQSYDGKYHVLRVRPVRRLVIC